MIGCYRLADAGDPQTYSAAVVSTLLQWPVEVIMAVTEPATGIPSKIKWLPSIAEITEACKDAFEPMQRALERKRIDETARLPPPATPRLSQAEMDAQFERLGLAHLRPGSKCDARQPRFTPLEVAEAREFLLRAEAEARGD